LAMARAALAAAEQVVPPYSCKHSRKDFTQPQLLALLLLKQFFKIGYRDVVAWVAEWSDLREALGLTKVPHFTAIQKAGARLLKKESLESLLDAGCPGIKIHCVSYKCVPLLGRRPTVQSRGITTESPTTRQWRGGGEFGPGLARLGRRPVAVRSLSSPARPKAEPWHTPSLPIVQYESGRGTRRVRYLRRKDLRRTITANCTNV
jgi:hypothetical protein